MNTTLLKKIFVPILLTLLAVTVQGSLLRFVLPNFPIPNLVVILVVFFGFYEVTAFGALLVFLIGIEMDLCSGVLLGPSAGAYSITFGILAALSTRLFVESGFAVVLAVFGSSLISSTVYLLLVYQFAPTAGRSFTIIFIEAVSTAVLAPLIFPLLKRILIPKRDRPSPRMSTRTRPRLATSQR